MRNTMTLGVSQNRLDTIRRKFKLFRDFSDAHAIVEVIHNRGDRHPRTAQHRSAALHSRLWSPLPDINPDYLGVARTERLQLDPGSVNAIGAAREPAGGSNISSGRLDRTGVRVASVSEIRRN